MWDFIFGPDGVRSQQINLIWLGLNPNFYRHILREEEQALNSLHISEICDKIWKSVADLRLNVISNLLRGACMVHKAQVDCLYSKTKNLFCYQSHSSLELSSSKWFYEDADVYRQPKGRKVKNCIEIGSQQLLRETEDFNPVLDYENLLLTDESKFSNSCREIDITLKECNPKLNFNRLQNDDNEELLELGEMTNMEKSNFLDILNINCKGRNRDKTNNLRMLDINDSSSKVLDENNECSLQVPRHHITSEMNIFNIVSIDQSNLNNESFRDPNNNVHNNFIASFNVTDLETNDFVRESETLPTVACDIALPDYDTFAQNISNHDDSVVNKSHKLGKRNAPDISKKNDQKRRRLLKMDKAIEFTAPQIISHVQSTLNFRCFCPRYDIVSTTRFRLISSDRLINSPTIRLPKPLLVLYKRNLKRRTTDENISILNSILDQDYNVDDTFDIPTKRRRKITQSNKDSNDLLSNQNQYDMDSYQLNLEKNPRCSSGHIHKDISKQEFCIEALAKFIENLENIETPNEENESLIFRKNKKEWNQSAILRKLSRLWIANEKHITMELICRNAKKQAAAIAFSSIIQLSSKGYIVIMKENESNHIMNIAMGPEIESKLNN